MIPHKVNGWPINLVLRPAVSEAATSFKRPPLRRPRPRTHRTPQPRRRALPLPGSLSSSARMSGARSAARSLRTCMHLFQIRNVTRVDQIARSPSLIVKRLVHPFQLAGHAYPDNGSYLRLRTTMLPRFLKTFLLASLLIVLPTLFILYQKHSDGTDWNEWSLNSGTWDAQTPAQRLPPSDLADGEASALHLEQHWNAGGAGPNFETTRVVDAHREEGTGDHATLYRIGDTLIDAEELEAFKQWRETHALEGTFGQDGNNQVDDSAASTDTWSKEASVHGGVIMPNLGNATAKCVHSDTK